MAKKPVKDTQKAKYFLTPEEGKSIASQYDYMDDSLSLQRTKASSGVGRTFVDFDENFSVKSDYNRKDYEYFRGGSTEFSAEQSIEIAQKAYERVGIIRNIIDTMSDLGCQGIRIEHPVKKHERFLQAWFEYVGGPSISERFLNMFYRLCNVPIKTAYGKISWPDEEEWARSKGDIDNTVIKNFKPRTREIPLRYTFVHPNCVEVVGGTAGLFIGKPYYVLKVSDTLKSDIAKLNTLNIPSIKEEYLKMMKDVQNSISKNTKYIPLDQDKFDVYYYKKDDWRVWAMPYMASIFDDLFMLEKMKLADLSALDGAISNIRHWTVGIIDTANPQGNILPTRTAINKLKNILANNVGGGTMDLVTGPEVSFKESATQVHKFLGKEKYIPTLDNIYDGMGVPPPLRSSGGSSTSANNYVSLKTLIERLQYGRNALIQFWNKQLRIIQKAMGHKHIGQVVFNQLILADEGAEKALLVQLVDRDIISAEAVTRYFGYIPEIEKIKVNREHKAREDERMPPKASQFHNPQWDSDIKKILVQNGEVTASEVGIDLEERKSGEEPRIDKEAKTQVKIAKFKPKGSPLTGRPKNVTETKKRKPKPKGKPQTGKTKASDLLWAQKTYEQIQATIMPALLSSVNKSNARKLTNEETKLFEDVKFSILCSLKLYDKVTPELLHEKLDPDAKIPREIQDIFESMKAEFVEKNQQQPTMEEVRTMQILSYLEGNLI